MCLCDPSPKQKVNPSFCQPFCVTPKHYAFIWLTERKNKQTKNKPAKEELIKTKADINKIENKSRTVVQ